MSTSSSAGTSVAEKLYSLIGNTPPPPVQGTLQERKEFAFARVHKALKLLGLPPSTLDSQRNIVKVGELDAKLPKVIHVAGTKGKGSTCVLCESILRHLGLKTGLFTSPHLVKVNERIRLNGKPISDTQLLTSFEKVYKILSENDSLLGFYKFITVLALDIFSGEDLDVVILEVGLGGLLDATNVVQSKTACGVTLLDYDHTEFLGTTIQEIAFQKAGIFSASASCFTVQNQVTEAMSVLTQSATSVGQSLSVSKAVEKECGLAGSHQKFNAGLAIDLCKVVATEKGISSEDFEAAVSKGLKEARYAGRCQEVEKNGNTYFLDGAHTHKSMNAACSWFKAAKKSERPNTLVFNCAYSKPLVELLKECSDITFDKVLFTPSESFKPTSKSPKSSSELLGLESATKEATWQDTMSAVYSYLNPTSEAPICSNLKLQAVLKEIESSAPSNVFVTGSLLLVGDVLNHLQVEIN